VSQATDHGTIRCTVVSPERPLFDGDVESVVVPGSEGELGILPRHAPLIGALGPGVVRLHGKNGVERFGIRGGFMLVKKNVVTLLVTDAVKPADIDRAKLESETESVRESLHHPRSEEEFQELLVQRRWCEVRAALLDEAKTSAHAAH
jgi:F-type H+-transporting ATPase subunit epsilon